MLTYDFWLGRLYGLISLEYFNMNVYIEMFNDIVWIEIRKYKGPFNGNLVSSTKAMRDVDRSNLIG